MMRMNQKISLIVLFLVLTLAIYGCAKTSDVPTEEQDTTPTTGTVTSDLTDFDQANQDLSELDNIDVNQLDF